MILSYLLLISGLSISAIAEYYSIMGLMAIFSAAPGPIAVMGISLGVGKLVMASWIKQYWARIPTAMRAYGLVSVSILMMITSIGCFGYLSKAHNDQNLVSGDVGAKLAIYDEKIKTARDNIEADRKQLRQMDDAVDQVMARSTSETGADKSVAIRKSQAKDRATLAKDIEANQKTISTLNDEATPIRAENRKVEAEVGPIKYIAAFIYGVAPDASMLEKAVTWIIIMIVVVFDPLAVIMLLAAQMTFAWNRKPEEEIVEDPATIVWTEEIKTPDTSATDSTFVNVEELEPVFEREEIPDFTDYSDGHIADPEPDEELPVIKPRWTGFSFPMSSIFGKPKEETYHEGDYSPYVPQQNLIEEVESVKEPVLITRIAYPESNYNTSMDERPGDYVEPPVRSELPREAAPGRNRGVMIPISAQADNNVVELGKASTSGFGNTFPTNPQRGDVYLRTDYLPNRLFKFNDTKWIEIDKDSTDLYAYDELYIKHLVDEIAAGRYDTDELTDLERSQIEEFLKK